MCSFDSSPDAIPEGSNLLLGRLDEQFPLLVKPETVRLGRLAVATL
jgi:hypothetical protein